MDRPPAPCRDQRGPPFLYGTLSGGGGRWWESRKVDFSDPFEIELESRAGNAARHIDLGARSALITGLVSDNGARRFPLPGKGGTRIGGDADLALVDLSRSSEVVAGELLDRHHLSPYVGRTLRGSVRRTLVRGRSVCLDNAVVGKPEGRFLRPSLD